MNNVLIVTNMLLQWAALLQQGTQLLSSAAAANRDVTDAELDGLIAGYSQAHAVVDADQVAPVSAQQEPG